MRRTLLLPVALSCAYGQAVGWHDALHQPARWYATPEAARIADNLLLYQRNNGGWDKNVDMAAPLSAADQAKLEREKSDPEAHSTIDNSSTYTQMEFLARVFTAGKDARYASAFRRGFEYVLQAQYPNGGWPQFYPLRHGYWDHITFNDDAMIGVMTMLRAVEKKSPEYAFLTDGERSRARQAVERGIDCILKTQVRQNGKLTVWCAQHDEKSLAPAKARAYEHPSLSGSESVGIVEFLMGIEHPSAAVVQSIQAAIAWFLANKLTGIRVVAKPAPGTPKGVDNTIVDDASAPPLWARFYELGTNRPIFSGRDSVIKYSMAEIEYERRNGYRWYTDRPAKLLERDYPVWLARK